MQTILFIKTAVLIGYMGFPNQYDIAHHVAREGSDQPVRQHGWIRDFPVCVGNIVFDTSPLGKLRTL